MENNILQGTETQEMKDLHSTTPAAIHTWQGRDTTGREPIITHPLLLQVGLSPQQHTGNGTPGNGAMMGTHKKAGAELRAGDWLQGVRTDATVLSNTAANAGSLLSWCTERVEQAAWGWGEC